MLNCKMLMLRITTTTRTYIREVRAARVTCMYDRLSAPRQMHSCSSNVGGSAELVHAADGAPWPDLAASRLVAGAEAEAAAAAGVMAGPGAAAATGALSGLGAAARAAAGAGAAVKGLSGSGAVPPAAAATLTAELLLAINSHAAVASGAAAKAGAGAAPTSAAAAAVAAVAAPTLQQSIDHVFLSRHPVAVMPLPEGGVDDETRTLLIR